MAILTEAEATTIRSKGLYWREVVQRESGSAEILRSELRELCADLGLRLLWITLRYAEQMEEQKEPKS